MIGIPVKRHLNLRMNVAIVDFLGNPLKKRKVNPALVNVLGKPFAQSYDSTLIGCLRFLQVAISYGQPRDWTRPEVQKAV